MVGKWHLGFRERGYDKPLTGGPIDCGFDSFFGLRASTDIPPYFYIRGDRAVEPPTKEIEANHTAGWASNQGAFWRAGGIAPDLSLDEVLPRFTKEAIEVITRHASGAEGQRPLMLYLAYPSPHTPWLPAEEFVGKSGAGLYGDFAAMVDDQIGQLLQTLRETGMEEETLLVFMSDNGPCWYEEDTEKFGHDSAGGLRGMKGDAWEAGHRMPFIVRWPGVVAPNARSAQIICFTDLLATFADAMGAELAFDAGPDSFSFLPVLQGEHPEDKPIRGPMVINAGSKPSMLTIRYGDWKLITGLGSGGFSRPKSIEPQQDGPTGQLYNLASDPGEKNNLFLQNPKVVASTRGPCKESSKPGEAAHPQVPLSIAARSRARSCAATRGGSIRLTMGWAWAGLIGRGRGNQCLPRIMSPSICGPTCWSLTPTKGIPRASSTPTAAWRKSLAALTRRRSCSTSAGCKTTASTGRSSNASPTGCQTKI